MVKVWTFSAPSAKKTLFSSHTTTLTRCPNTWSWTRKELSSKTGCHKSWTPSSSRRSSTTSRTCSLRGWRKERQCWPPLKKPVLKSSLRWARRHWVNWNWWGLEKTDQFEHSHSTKTMWSGHAIGSSKKWMTPVSSPDSNALFLERGFLPSHFSGLHPLPPPDSPLPIKCLFAHLKKAYPRACTRHCRSQIILLLLLLLLLCSVVCASVVEGRSIHLLSLKFDALQISSSLCFYYILSPLAKKKKKSISPRRSDWVAKDWKPTEAEQGHICVAREYRLHCCHELFGQGCQIRLNPDRTALRFKHSHASPALTFTHSKLIYD